MCFYHFSQNNSGGYFIGPARHVFIQASSPGDANRIAQDNDIYFSGCRSGRDCQCCGDRWQAAWEYSEVFSAEEIAEEIAYHGADNVIVIYQEGA